MRPWWKSRCWACWRTEQEIKKQTKERAEKELKDENILQRYLSDIAEGQN
jgi:wyosine [tRNA(Phe)-imidazoG37] synthetase (radical SAM superfamily)